MKRYVFTFFIFCFLWEILAFFIDSRLFPRVSEIVFSLSLEVSIEAANHVFISLKRLFLGMISGAFIGGLLGIFCGWWEKADRVLTPFVYLTYPFPKVVLVPILIMILGVGEESKITLIALVVSYQIFLTFRDSIDHFPKLYIDSGRVFGGGSLAILRKIVLPLIAHRVFSGLKISLGTAMAVLFFAETYATEFGIGFYVWDVFSRFDFVQVYGASLVYCLIGFFLYYLLEYFEGKSQRNGPI